MAATLSIICQIVDDIGELFATPFSVDASSEDTIETLRDTIQAKRALPLTPPDLTLWKLLVPQPVLLQYRTKTNQYIEKIEFPDLHSDEALNGNGIIQVLDPFETLSTYWKDKLLEKHIHVVVQMLRTYSTTLNTDRVVRFKDVSIEKFLDREEYCKRAIEADPPSFSARVENFSDAQKDLPILNGRPSENTGPPIGLFHPVFNTFQAAIRSKKPLDPDEESLSLAYHFLEASAKIYDTKGARSDAMHKLMNKLLGAALTTIEVKGAKSDGALIADCLGISAYLAVVEEQVEIGAGGGDPYNQAGFSYRKYWAQDGQKPIRDLCYCPTMILATAGPWLCVSGAVFLDEVVVEPLTDYIWLGGDPSNTERQHSIIRLFDALKSSVQELRKYYNLLDQQPITKQPITELFPFIKQYGTKTFEYQSYLMPLHLDKHIYKAQCTETHQLLVVKFVDTYNAEAHKLLAQHGTAPKLHYLSDDLYGGKRMVVMEHIEGKPPFKTLTRAQFADITSAVGLLHSRSLVFGDLRPPNMLVVPGRKVQLLDFDWCGVAGVARYPGHPLNDRVEWAEGMGLGRVMEKAHDLAMLEKLKVLIEHD